MTITLIFCLLGLIAWIALSAPSPSHWIKSVLAEAAKWCFVIGLLWTVFSYVGKVAF